MMSFDALASATSAVTLVLAIGWLFAGRLLLRRWRIEASEVALLLGRRIGSLYLGLSLIFFLARTSPPSDLRTSLSIGACVVCTLLAALGIFEFRARRAGPAILISVAVEIVLAAGYAWLVWGPAGGVSST